MVPPETRHQEVEALSLALSAFELDEPAQSAAPMTRQQVISLIHERTALLASGADYFSLLGLPAGAATEDVHDAYVELSKHLRPERLAELGIHAESLIAENLLAQLGIAFTVLTDRVRGPQYLETLRAKPRKPPRAPR
jgi:hypothetical protein